MSDWLADYLSWKDEHPEPWAAPEEAGAPMEPVQHEHADQG